MTTSAFNCYAIGGKPLNFIGNMADLANAQAAIKDSEREEKRMRFDEARDAREQFLMTQLTITYFQPIKDAICRASEKGNREKYMNFTRAHCKANFPTLGSPTEVLQRWLTDITNPNSQYAPKINYTDDVGDSECAQTRKPDHLEGLKFNVWNNGAFTVHFTW